MSSHKSLFIGSVLLCDELPEFSFSGNLYLEVHWRNTSYLVSVRLWFLKIGTSKTNLVKLKLLKSELSH